MSRPQITIKPQEGQRSIRQIRGNLRAGFREPGSDSPDTWVGPLGQRAELLTYGPIKPDGYLTIFYGSGTICVHSISDARLPSCEGSLARGSAVGRVGGASQR